MLHSFHKLKNDAVRARPLVSGAHTYIKEGFSMLSFFSSIVLGLVAGYVACRIMNLGSDLILNLIVGVIGSAVGNGLFGLLGIYTYSWIGKLLFSIIGACILLAVVNYLVKRYR